MPLTCRHHAHLLQSAGPYEPGVGGLFALMEQNAAAVQSLPSQRGLNPGEFLIAEVAEHAEFAQCFMVAGVAAQLGKE